MATPRKLDGPPCPKCSKPMTRGPLSQSGKLRWECKDSNKNYCYSTTNPYSGVYKDRAGRAVTAKNPTFKRTIRPDVKRYIITAAQNATPVHPAFHAMKAFAKANKATLIVIPLRYKNPTSRWSASQSNDETWDAAVVPYLHNVRLRINENLVLLADIKTQPTASSPLTGFEAITASESGILGHTKLQLKTVPTPNNKFPKLLTTTGACTKPNYTDSKAGKIGEFHHTLGAVIVEVEGKLFHMRHVNCDRQSGAFSDLEHRYTDVGKFPNAPIAALIMGDTHVDFIDPQVEKATFGPTGMVAKLKPQKLIWHDLLDAYSVNPHHEGNAFNAFAKMNAGLDDAAAEVRRAIAFVRKHTPKGVTSHVISSNHDDFLRRWVVRADWRGDPKNAEFYLQTALYMLQGTKMGTGGTETPSPFSLWVHKLSGNTSIQTVGSNQSLLVSGVELSMHGDRGPNGSRGSIKNLRRIGVKSVIGHSHSPGIEEGCYQVGTSTRLRLEYNSGPSSWLNAHCVLHADGKRQLVFIINGEWRL